MTNTDAKIMREADAWQPIEQIVADGRDVLVGCWVIDDEGETDAFWSSWTVTLNGGSLGCDGTWGDPPSHFCEIPTPPALPGATS